MQQVKIEMKKNTKKVKRYLYLLILVSVLALIGIWFWCEIYIPKAPGSDNQTFFFIKQGEGLRDIASNLKKKSIIKSRTSFELFALARGSAAHLLAGVYALSPSMNVPEVINRLTSGNTIKEKITIIEGWNLRDIGWYFESEGMFQNEELFEVTGFPGVDYSKNQDLPQSKDFSDKFDFLKEKSGSIGLEGYLFPDTYEIERDEVLEQIIGKFLQNFDKKTEDLKEEIAKQGKTLSEVLIMASLLEKEIKTYEDKQIAAGILWKRVREGWPLQVDATLTYLTGKGSSELTKEDLNIDSPYNTYKHYGLPIGPICNPGLSSIKAAIYYKDNDFWYYLTTPEGETIFSKTLKEHNVAKYKYVK